jgi:hypothetical protein
VTETGRGGDARQGVDGRDGRTLSVGTVCSVVTGESEREGMVSAFVSFPSGLGSTDREEEEEEEDEEEDVGGEASGVVAVLSISIFSAVNKHRVQTCILHA